MSQVFRESFAFGSSKTGLAANLRGQAKKAGNLDTGGVISGSPAFAEMGGGVYDLAATLPDDALFVHVTCTTDAALFGSAAVPVPATVTGGGGGGSGGVLGPVSATLLASALATTAGGLRRNLSIFQNTRITFPWNVVDGTGAPVDLTGHSVKFVCHDQDGDTVLFVVEDEDIALVESDPDDNPGILDMIQVAVEPEDVAALVGVYNYKLWDLTLEFVWSAGDFTVYRAPLPPP